MSKHWQQAPRLCHSHADLAAPCSGPWWGLRGACRACASPRRGEVWWWSCRCGSVQAHSSVLGASCFHVRNRQVLTAATGAGAAGPGVSWCWSSLVPGRVFIPKFLQKYRIFLQKYQIFLQTAFHTGFFSKPYRIFSKIRSSVLNCSRLFCGPYASTVPKNYYYRRLKA